MSSVYAKRVLLEYKNKRASSALSPALVHPTPAKLRDECLLVFKERFKRKDEHILRFFFGTADDVTQYPKLIDKCDIDRFRPLVNILRNPERKTDDINIELLAWLINFEPRPFDVFDNHSSNDFTNTDTNNASEDDPDATSPTENKNGDISNPSHKPDNPISLGQYLPPAPPPIPEYPDRDINSDKSSEPESRRGSLKEIAIYTGIILLIISGIYIYYNSNKSVADTPIVTGNTLKRTEACMYWAGDHYEQVSCNQIIKDALVIALDSFKLQHLKKINRPDTLTQAHVGRVWYCKTDGNMEFYTAEGMHPVDIKKRLKPATAYIIDKYILSRTD